MNRARKNKSRDGTSFGTKTMFCTSFGLIFGKKLDVWLSNLDLFLYLDFKFNSWDYFYFTARANNFELYDTDVALE